MLALFSCAIIVHAVSGDGTPLTYDNFGVSEEIEQAERKKFGIVGLPVNQELAPLPKPSPKRLHQAYQLIEKQQRAMNRWSRKGLAVWRGNLRKNQGHSNEGHSMLDRVFAKPTQPSSENEFLPLSNFGIGAINCQLGGKMGLGVKHCSPTIIGNPYTQAWCKMCAPHIKA